MLVQTSILQITAASEHSLNWYTYCSGKPVGYYDPSGHEEIDANSFDLIYASGGTNTGGGLEGIVIAITSGGDVLITTSKGFLYMSRGLIVNSVAAFQNEIMKAEILIDSQLDKIDAILKSITESMAEWDINNKVPEGASELVPGRVQNRINVANIQTRYTPLRPSTGEPVSAGLDHVIEGHFNRPLANRRSIFSTSIDELVEILQRTDVVQSPVTAIDGGQFVRGVILVR